MATYILSCTIFKILWIIIHIFAVDGDTCHVSGGALIRGEPLNSGLQNLDSSHSVVVLYQLRRLCVCCDVSVDTGA